ncbi:GntR family transcriptional regulator [Kitasatospora sp. McL0602]|uniref:GntR family transcriptional regulator n=1 Tax=Kitasatospora sp. McL0602 TaxID=3439530 RepID=UPI003F8ADD37
MRSKEPPYLRIADVLRQRIADGEWRVGERLPSRAKLGDELEVGPNVVQRAMEQLITEGLLFGVAGSGTFVQTPPERRRMVRSRHLGLLSTPQFRADFRVSGSSGNWVTESGSGVPAPPEIADRLGIAPGDPTVHTSYEFLVDGKPVHLAYSWEPQALTDRSPVVMPEMGPLAGRGVVERMAAIGITVERAVERPRPARAGSEYALLLGIASNDLVTLIERTYFDADGRPVETADFVIPDSRWEIHYELPVEPVRPAADAPPTRPDDVP